MAESRDLWLMKWVWLGSPQDTSNGLECEIVLYCTFTTLSYLVHNSQNPTVEMEKPPHVLHLGIFSPVKLTGTLKVDNLQSRRKSTKRLAGLKPLLHSFAKLHSLLEWSKTRRREDASNHWKGSDSINMAHLYAHLQHQQPSKSPYSNKIKSLQSSAILASM